MLCVIQKYRELIEGYERSMGLDLAQPVMEAEGWSWLNAVFFTFSLQTSIG